jgi:beta-glucosidase
VDAGAVAALEAAILPGDLQAIATHIDALGVNYYHGDLVSGEAPAEPPKAGDAPTDRPGRSPFPAGSGHPNERGLDRTNMNWEVQPEALTRLLSRVWNEYAEPAGTVLYVTENGAAYDDEPVIEDGEVRVHDVERAEFLRGHLGATLDAIEQGVDVRGYFYWSMLDNFEWAWGYEKRFGIIRVDYDTQERTIKDSGREYIRIIADRSLDPAPVAASA